MPLNVVGGFVPAGLTETIDAFIAKYFGCFDTPGRAELCLAYVAVFFFCCVSISLNSIACTREWLGAKHARRLIVWEGVSVYARSLRVHHLVTVRASVGAWNTHGAN
jgi:hypothetical protein